MGSGGGQGRDDGDGEEKESDADPEGEPEEEGHCGGCGSGAELGGKDGGDGCYVAEEGGPMTVPGVSTLPGHGNGK